MNNNVTENVEKKDTFVEKSFIQSIIVSVITILISLFCLTAATWAWCSDEMSSSPNVFEAASGDLTIKVIDPDGNVIDPTLSNGYHYYHFESGKSYTVVLSASGTASNCYSVVTVNGIDYYTNLVPTTDQVENNPSTYKISSDSDVEVRFDLRWGIHDNEPTLINGSIVYITSQIVNIQ